MFDSTKDAEILRLRQELATERLRVSELTKAVIALSDRSAFQALYPRERKEEVTKKALSNFSLDPRKEVYKPRLSFQDIEEAMAKKAEEGTL
ncbi:MAG: hypothetical protein ACREIQ_09070 [Nitrospiria bacterium]